MHYVQFTIDLGDCTARFTGQVVGTDGHDWKVIYYCPASEQYLPIDLTTRQIARSWQQQTICLPLMPEVVQPSGAEPTAIPALIRLFTSCLNARRHVKA